MTTDAPSSPAGHPRASSRVLVLVGVLLVAAGAVAAVGVRALGRGTPPPHLGSLPDFRLTERSGRPLSRADLRGRPWVADFIFTQCGGACPAMTARLARLRREIPADVTFVSFTVDPGHDTPEVLSRYAASFRADETWRFVTGPAPDLYALSVGGFKLAAMEVPPGDQAAGGDGPFLHSSKFVLVDGEGGIRGYYDSTDEQAMRALVADAAAVRATR
ncbi:MAG TPA: SCO family protein [Vicinamibacteria bacterium]|nr:SCO family protein [Vicinamibacteria bacterium]